MHLATQPRPDMMSYASRAPCRHERRATPVEALSFKGCRWLTDGHVLTVCHTMQHLKWVAIGCGSVGSGGWSERGMAMRARRWIAPARMARGLAADVAMLQQSQVTDAATVRPARSHQCRKCGTC